MLFVLVEQYDPRFASENHFSQQNEQFLLMGGYSVRSKILKATYTSTVMKKHLLASPAIAGREVLLFLYLIPRYLPPIASPFTILKQYPAAHSITFMSRIAERKFFLSPYNP